MLPTLQEILLFSAESRTLFVMRFLTSATVHHLQPHGCDLCQLILYLIHFGINLDRKSTRGFERLLYYGLGETFCVLLVNYVYYRSNSVMKRRNPF